MKKFISLVLCIMMLMSIVCIAPVSVGAADAELITVYFENNWLWTNVFYHSWGSSIVADTEWSKGAVELVGTAENGNEIYKATIGSDATGVIFAGTKNDGSGAIDQTPDIKEGFYDGICYYMTWDNGNAVDSYTYVETPAETEAPVETDPVETTTSAVDPTEAPVETTTSAVDPTEAPVETDPVETTTSAVDPTEAPADTCTVYFVDYADSFEKAYAYAWNSNTDEAAAWPGVEMTFTGEYASDGGKIYSVTFDKAYANVIFTDGAGQQTEDLVLEEDKYLWWGNELWYNSLQELESDNEDHFMPATGDDAPTEAPTEPSTEDTDIERIRVFFQNNWMWSDINIYFWGSETSTIPSWPGVAMEYYDNDGTYDIYYYDVPADITGLIINGTKDDGTGTTDQTPDITEGWYDGICYSMTWNDGNDVGSVNISEIFPEEESTAEIAGYSISLGGTIGVKFYYSLSDDVAQDSDAKVVFTVPDTGSTYTYEQSIGSAEIIDGFYVFTCYVAAKEMTSKIQAQFVSSIVESEVTEYTVKDYAVYMIQRADVYAAEQALVKAMLNYGAAAQTYFGYNTDNLANDTEYMTEAEKLIESVNFSGITGLNELSGEEAGVTYYGTALSLKSEVAVKHYFIIDESVDVYSLSPSVNIGDISIAKNGNLYEVKISGIPAFLLGAYVVLNLGGLTLDFIPITYGEYAQNSGDADLYNVMNAMVAYGSEAMLYGSN